MNKLARGTDAIANFAPLLSSNVLHEKTLRYKDSVHVSELAAPRLTDSYTDGLLSPFLNFYEALSDKVTDNRA